MDWDRGRRRGRGHRWGRGRRRVGRRGRARGGRGRGRSRRRCRRRTRSGRGVPGEDAGVRGARLLVHRRHGRRRRRCGRCRRCRRSGARGRRVSGGRRCPRVGPHVRTRGVGARPLRALRPTVPRPVRPGPTTRLMATTSAAARPPAARTERERRCVVDAWRRGSEGSAGATRGVRPAVPMRPADVDGVRPRICPNSRERKTSSRLMTRSGPRSTVPRSDIRIPSSIGSRSRHHGSRSLLLLSLDTAFPLGGYLKRPGAGFFAGTSDPRERAGPMSAGSTG